MGTFHMAINSVIHTNQQSIDRVLATGLPVVLAFWGRQQPLAAPVEATLARLADQYAGKALFAKVDAATEKALVQRFAVPQIPALVFTKQGKTETTLVSNAIEERSIQAWLDYLVSGGARPLPPAPTTPRATTAGTTGASDASDKPITLTDANFQAVISKPGPVLVDFWAPWCGPCRMVAPTVEQLARNFTGRAIIGKLNVDENPQTAQRYQIMSIPALYIFKNGRVVEQLVGAQPASVLQQRLAQHV
jgi:thioredoxin 1